MVSSTPRPHFTLGKDPAPIVQESGWAPGPVSTGRKSRPHRDSNPDCPARSFVSIPTELPGTLSKILYLLRNYHFQHPIKWHAQTIAVTLMRSTWFSSLRNLVCFPLSCTLFGANILPSTATSNTLKPCISLKYEERRPTRCNN